MGDANIDVSEDNGSHNTNLSEFCDIVGLENLISDPTCVTKSSSSSIDVILTNKKRSLKNSRTVSTGINDFHKMTITTLRTSYERLKPITIKYRSYKHFNENHFLHDLRIAPFYKCKHISNEDEAFECFKDIFLSVVNKRAPIKTKIIRGAQVPFMKRELNQSCIHPSNHA